MGGEREGGGERILRILVFLAGKTGRERKAEKRPVCTVGGGEGRPWRRRNRPPSRYRWGTVGCLCSAAMSGFHSKRFRMNRAMPVTSLLSSKAMSSP